MAVRLKHGSLFSGIGGFDLAAAWMGWENVFHCEIDPFCRRVLGYHFPESTCYEDIRTANFTGYRGRIDIITGGFPCQPFSVAGKRRGNEDERYMWPHMLRAVREIRPVWVVAENVRGLVSWNGGLVFEEVCTDLEAEGYEVLPFIIPAAAVDAPHRRERVWIIAYAKCHDGRSPQPGGDGKEEEVEGINWQEDRTTGKPSGADNIHNAWAQSDRCPVPHAEIHGTGGAIWELEAENGSKRKPEEYRKEDSQPRNDGCKRTSSDSYDRQQPQQQECRTKDRGRTPKSWSGTGVGSGSGDITGNFTKGTRPLDTGPCGVQRDTSDTDSAGFQTKGAKQQTKRTEQHGMLGRAAPHSNGQPCQNRGNETGEHGKENKGWSTGRRKYGHIPDHWKDWPTQPPLCTGDDGFPGRLAGITFPKWRNESIKSMGNAIVPQVVYGIFKAIEEYIEQVS